LIVNWSNLYSCTLCTCIGGMDFVYRYIWHWYTCSHRLSFSISIYLALIHL